MFCIFAVVSILPIGDRTRQENRILPHSSHLWHSSYCQSHNREVQQCVCGHPLPLSCLEQAIGLVHNFSSVVAQGKTSTRMLIANQFEGKISSITSFSVVVFMLFLPFSSRMHGRKDTSIIHFRVSQMQLHIPWHILCRKTCC